MVVAELQPWVAELPADALLFPAWGVVGSERKASIRPDTYGAAWREAVRWGGAREVAWKPASRMTGRPERAFRAAFQAARRLAGAYETVIDELVGHHGKTVRSRHHAAGETLLAPMRAAVDSLPSIDWRGPREVGAVISLAGRRRAGGGGEVEG